MNISAISSSSASIANFTAMQALRTNADEASGTSSAKPANSGRDPAAIKKASSQFEAIILRQLLGPSIEPMMSGGLGGEKDTGSGVYSYMLTDTLATSLSQGKGLGLASMLEKQLTPRVAKADNKNDGQSTAKQQSLNPLKLP